MIAQPLRGIRVLDLGQVYNGPYCALLLASQGAEVIKIEPPTGEIVRRAGTSPGGASYSFLMLNADKKGITLNLKSERGRDLFLDLAERSDVVVENFRAGVLDELGIGWSTLSQRNPRLILASGRGYRGGSPYERYGAMDFTVQAISGQMAITGFPGQPPVKSGATLCDMLGATHLFSAVLLCLLERAATGRGRPVEVAMLDATFPSLMGYASPYLERGFDAGRTGNRHAVPGSSPYGVYPTQDGWVAILCVTDAQWRDFAEITGAHDLAVDPELATGRQRVAAPDRIEPHVHQWTEARTTEDALATLSEAGIPCAPVRSIGAAVDDPYNVEQGLLRTTGLPGARRGAGPG